MDLAHKKCVPCEGGVDPMKPDEIKQYLGVVSGWSLVDGPEITKEYVFKDFVEALAFANAVGKIAEEEGHHPDIFLHDWNKVELRLSTHAIKGLHLNDFVLASKVDVMYRKSYNN